jgi:hypothetical protein
MLVLQVCRGAGAVLHHWHHDQETEDGGSRNPEQGLLGPDAGVDTRRGVIHVRVILLWRVALLVALYDSTRWKVLSLPLGSWLYEWCGCWIFGNHPAGTMRVGPSAKAGLKRNLYTAASRSCQYYFSARSYMLHKQEKFGDQSRHDRPRVHCHTP